MKYFTFLLFLLTISFSLAKDSESKLLPEQIFLNLLKEYPERVFSPKIDQKTRDSLKAYQEREKLPNGLRYGDSVRNYSLKGKTAKKVRQDMQKNGCKFKLDVLREPMTNKPMHYENGNLPIWIFLCSDGGLVRVKPLGDPKNLYRPQPHGSKGLRYPYNAKFEGFADEALKVDNEGNAIPKSRADLNSQEVVGGWSKDAHTDF